MFIGCDDVLSGAQRPFHQRPRGFQATHRFDDDVDLRVVDDRFEVIGKKVIGKAETAGLGRFRTPTF
jgi:hypothetical protein